MLWALLLYWSCVSQPISGFCLVKFIACASHHPVCSLYHTCTVVHTVSVKLVPTVCVRLCAQQCLVLYECRNNWVFCEQCYRYNRCTGRYLLIDGGTVQAQYFQTASQAPELGPWFKHLRDFAVSLLHACTLLHDGTLPFRSSVGLRVHQLCWHTCTRVLLLSPSLCLFQASASPLYFLSFFREGSLFVVQGGRGLVRNGSPRSGMHAISQISVTVGLFVHFSCAVLILVSSCIHSWPPFHLLSMFWGQILFGCVLAFVCWYHQKASM